MPKNSWVSLHSASKRLDKTSDATRKLVVRGKIKGTKSSDNRWLVNVESLEKYANDTYREVLQSQRAS